MSASPRRQRDPLVLFGSRIGRDTAIYAVGTAAVLPFSLVTVAVFTRFLQPAQYGELAILFVFASLLTTVYNLVVLQGTLMSVFGGAGEDAVPVEDRGSGGEGMREALGTGLLMTVVVAAAGTALLVAVAAPLAALLLGDAGRTGAVIWAGVSAALGSIWRLTVNLLRMERRPWAFAGANSLRPLLALAFAWPLLAAGHGIEGALAGTALGTLVGVLIALAATHGSYALAVRRSDVRQILRFGGRYVPVILGLWVVHNADIFMLARFAEPAEVGLYRVASRIASIGSYFVSAFLMAWAPLEGASVMQAAYRRRGMGAVRSRLVTAYVIAALTLVLAIAVAADLLIQVAGPAYAPAAPLIPIVGLGFVAYGAFIVLVRSIRIPRRALVYALSAVGAAVAFLAISAVLIPPFGGYGAAVSVVAAMLLVSALWVGLDRRSDEPVPFEAGRILSATGVFAAALAVVRGAIEIDGALRPIAEVLAMLVYLAALVLLRIVPMAELRRIVAMLREALPRRRGRKHLGEALGRLTARQRLVVELVARHGLGVAEVARRTGIPESTVSSELVAGLGEVGDFELGELGVTGEVAAYLTSDVSAAERDAAARGLWDRGVDPLDLHSLEQELGRLRRLRRRGWERLDGF